MKKTYNRDRTSGLALSGGVALGMVRTGAVEAGSCPVMSGRGGVGDDEGRGKKNEGRE